MQDWERTDQLVGLEKATGPGENLTVIMTFGEQHMIAPSSECWQSAVTL